MARKTYFLWLCEIRNSTSGGSSWIITGLEVGEKNGPVTGLARRKKASEKGGFHQQSQWGNHRTMLVEATKNGEI